MEFLPLFLLLLLLPTSGLEYNDTLAYSFYICQFAENVKQTLLHLNNTSYSVALLKAFPIGQSICNRKM